MAYRHGNFSRGYDIATYLLEGEKLGERHTLRGAAKEFRISETTARADFFQVYYDASDGMCPDPEKTLRHFKRAYCYLHPTLKKSNK